MKSITDILLWGAGLVAFVFSVYEFIRFATAVDPATRTQDMWMGTSHLYLSLAAFAVAVICMGWAYARRPHVQEEIHVTK